MSPPPTLRVRPLADVRRPRPPTRPCDVFCSPARWDEYLGVWLHLGTATPCTRRPASPDLSESWT